MALLFLQRHSFLLHLLFLLALLPPFTHQIQQQRHHPKINTVDLNALIAIKNSLIEIPTTNFFSTWDVTASDPCSSFSGVTCALDHFSVTLRVTILTLGTGLYDSSRLAGSLSNSIANLTELTQLILSPGIVTGPIPSQLGRLGNLRVLSLTNNCLTGTIPDSLSALKKLHTLDLSYNQLTGSIPPGLTNLPELKVLILASNSLSGELPTVSAQLLHLDFKSNRFTGLLPPSMPLSLRYLSLSDNIMWGPLNGLESLSELVYLDLSMNKFSGPIPTSLFFSTTLSSLFLQRNNLSGRFPQQQEGPTQLNGEGSIVDLSHNFLTGELSTVLAGVESLFLNNNRLIGSVPEEYIKSVYHGSTRTLYLQHNYITEFTLEPGSTLPDTTSICLSYNCLVPPVGLMACPVSAGAQVSRPVAQCSVFNNGSSRG